MSIAADVQELEDGIDRLKTQLRDREGEIVELVIDVNRLKDISERSIEEIDKVLDRANIVEAKLTTALKLLEHFGVYERDLMFVENAFDPVKTLKLAAR